MSYYAIGIGGTGAKCLESLIHLCAAGLMPDYRSLNLLFVDSDRSNGNGNRTGELLRSYQSCKSNYVGGQDLLKTTIPSLQPDSDDSNRWSPTSIGERLDNFIGKNRLDAEFANLFDTLFSPTEAETVLNEGFRGRPSIGSAVMANKVDLDNTEPWTTLRARMQADAGNGRIPKVVIFGSIFGGTGAAGFPTISRLLHNWANGFQQNPLEIGGVLILPYFSFDGNSIPDTELHVKSHDFVLNTQAALKYYNQQEFHKILKVIYLLGADDQREMPVTSIGGGEQENPAHWIELCAAFAGINFFGNDNANLSTYRLLSRQARGSLQWSDLPHPQAQEKLLQLARFSFAFLSTYYPMLENVESVGKGYRAPWYIDFFEFRSLNLRERLGVELRNTKEYCEKFLQWLANIEFSVTGSETGHINLVDYSSFAQVNLNQPVLRGNRLPDNSFRAAFNLNGFENIILPNMNREAASLAHLWEKMCNELPPRDTNENAWSFLNTLYRQCGTV